MNFSPPGVSSQGTSQRSSGRGWLVLVGCLLGCWSVSAAAQTFYKWTDERGTVHFSDSPPTHTKNVEERQLPNPPPAAEQPAATDDAGAQEEGPSRVVVVERKTPHTGPSAVHVSGTVKNVGRSEARNVVVTISAVDVTQGTPCLREDAAVAPGTLQPGDTGNFDVDLDNPCLFGQPALNITPVWE